MFTKKEKEILLQLIVNEQVYHMIAKEKYDSDEYKFLEELKVKIREM